MRQRQSRARMSSVITDKSGSFIYGHVNSEFRVAYEERFLGGKFDYEVTDMINMIMIALQRLLRPLRYDSVAFPKLSQIPPVSYILILL